MSEEKKRDEARGKRKLIILLVLALQVKLPFPVPIKQQPNIRWGCCPL